jgi:hypothetical protein
VPAFPREVVDSDWPVYVHGADRTAVTVAGFALATRWSRELTWVDIRDRSVPEERYDPILKGVVPGIRDHIPLVPEELFPDLELSHVAAEAMDLQPEAGEADSAMIAFLRLPRIAQALIGQSSESGSRATFLATNADRIGRIYPDRIEKTAALVGAIQAQGVKLVMTSTGPERKDRAAFHFVYRVDSSPTAPWSEATITLEQGELLHDASATAPVALNRLDFVTRILRPFDTPP